MDDYNITIRINEYGMHLCRANRLKEPVGPAQLRYNEPFESVPVELNRGLRNMIYRFRTDFTSESELRTRITL
jgi:hypothetical protein